MLPISRFLLQPVAVVHATQPEGDGDMLLLQFQLLLAKEAKVVGVET